MMEASRKRTAPFISVMDRLNLFYGITTISEQEAINIGLYAWDAIGNKELSYYRLAAEITDYKVVLPCNVHHIEAVSINNSECATIPESALVSQEFSNPPETPNPAWISDIYPLGKFLKYRHKGEYLEFDITDAEVEIIYSGISCDNYGLPFLNEKELMAIACYIAYTYFFKKFAAGVVGNTQVMVQNLEMKWHTLCPDARVPYEFTQNQIDRILDASFAWNWKSYGRSFKTPV